MTTFRVWSEYLPFEQALNQDVVALLVRHHVHPTFAVHHDADIQMLAEVLKCYQSHNLEPGIWPLLTDQEGYWPSEYNGARYFEHVDELMNQLEDRGISPTWLAVDLEPPFRQMDQLRHISTPLHKSLLEIARQNLDRNKFLRAVEHFDAGVERIRRRQWKTMSVALPMVAHDLRDGQPLWQDLFESPWEGVRWDRAGIMAYGSMVQGYARGWLSEEDVRAIHFRLFRHLVRRFGHAAHVSLGITGTGKLGDEPIYTAVAPLARDVGAAMAAGIEDIAIFCLEGILQQTDPEHWLHQITHAKAALPPMTIKTQGVRFGGWLTRQAIKRWAHQLNTNAH